VESPSEKASAPTPFIEKSTYTCFDRTSFIHHSIKRITEKVKPNQVLPDISLATPQTKTLDSRRDQSGV